jgi:hypothetical protein
LTLDQFVAAHDGQFLVWDPRVGAQCVALVEFYARDVLAMPPVWANAVDWWGKDAAYETWSRNVWGDRTSKPPRGAIVVWGQNARAGTGIFGHIAICVDPGDGLTFGVFEQNYPTGSRCHVGRHPYDGVIGWGVRVLPPAPPPADPCAPILAQLHAAADQLTTYRTAVAAWAAGVPK